MLCDNYSQTVACNLNENLVAFVCGSEHVKINLLVKF